MVLIHSGISMAIDPPASTADSLQVAKAPRAAALEIIDLEKAYGSQKAVHGVNLSVAQGEFVAIIGPSGSGKTSVLMMVAGFTDPTRGDVQIGGRSMVGVPPEQRDIGVVFQNYALFPHMSVGQNVAFPLEMRKVRREEIARRVDDALKLVGLEGYGRRHPHQLSGGQQQRVALARAIVFRPTILLMDEPLGALDKQLRQQMQLELRTLHREIGTTVLYITHDQGEALALADRIAVMRDGRVVQIDAPEKLYRQPVNQFVATFIGDCNLLATEGLVRVQDGWRVSVGGYSGVVPIENSMEPFNGNSRIAVRPHLATVKAGDIADGLSGKLLDRIFMGESTEYVIEVNGGKTFIVRQSTSHAPLSTPVGASVKVSWSWAEARIL